MKTFELQTMLSRWIPEDKTKRIARGLKPIETQMHGLGQKQDDLPVLDMDILNGLLSVTKDKFPNILQIFISNGGMLLETLQRAGAHSNLEELERTAHALKSLTGQVGALRLQAIVMDIENLAQSETDMNGIADMVSRAVEEWDMIIDAFKSLQTHIQ